MRARYLLKSAVAALFLATLSTIAPAQALSLEKVPAPWVYIYGSHDSVTNLRFASSAATPNGKHLGSLSTFKVNYINVPLVDQYAVQAAIDIWSDNWSSSVPINVVANFVQQ